MSGTRSPVTSRTSTAVGCGSVRTVSRGAKSIAPAAFDVAKPATTSPSVQSARARERRIVVSGALVGLRLPGAAIDRGVNARSRGAWRSFNEPGAPLQEPLVLVERAVPILRDPKATPSGAVVKTVVSRGRSRLQLRPTRGTLAPADSLRKECHNPDLRTERQSKIPADSLGAKFESRPVFDCRSSARRLRRTPTQPRSTAARNDGGPDACRRVRAPGGSRGLANGRVPCLHRCGCAWKARP